jgi:hypothetical protein
MPRVLVATLLLTLAFAAPAQASRMAAVDAADAPHAFVVGTDGALYQAPPGGFLARVGGSGLRQEPVAVTRMANGNLTVFARGTDDVLYASSASDWSSWVPLGSGLAGSPEAILDAAGRVQVFARGSDGAMWHTGQDAGGWSPWERLGGTLAGEPRAILDQQSKVVVFARETNGKLAYTTGDLKTWTSLGVLASGDPAPARNVDGRLELFFRGTDGAVWDAYQPTVGAPFSLTRFGGEMIGAAATVLDGQGRLHFLLHGSNHALWAQSQTTAGGTWSPFTALGGSLTADPAAVRDGVGRVHVFFLGADDTLFSTEQDAAGWRPITPLGSASPPPPPPPAAVAPTPTPTPVNPIVVPPLRAINVALTMSVAGKPGRTSTRIKALALKNVPAGATVTATCPSGCARKSLVVRHAHGTVSLDKIAAGRALRVGTKIRIEVKVSGMIGAVKRVTVRAKRKPTVATRCLQPGATTESLC